MLLMRFLNKSLGDLSHLRVRELGRTETNVSAELLGLEVSVMYDANEEFESLKEEYGWTAHRFVLEDPLDDHWRIDSNKLAALISDGLGQITADALQLGDNLFLGRIVGELLLNNVHSKNAQAAQVLLLFYKKKC